MKILHSAVKLSMDNANSKEIMLTLATFRDRWMTLEHPGAIYCKKGVIVERTAFDPAYGAELRQKLASSFPIL